MVAARGPYHLGAIPPPAQPLPSTAFATAQSSFKDRFEAWRSGISVLFDVAPLAQGDPLDGFHVQVHAVHPGQLLLVDLRFARSQARAAHDGLDHDLVQWYRDGGFIGQHSDRDDLLVRAGDVVVFDMARTQHTVAENSRVLFLVVWPRWRGPKARSASSPG